MAGELGDPVTNHIEQAINQIDYMVTVNQLPQMNDHLATLKIHLEQSLGLYLADRKALNHKSRSKKTKLW